MAGNKKQRQRISPQSTQSFAEKKHASPVGQGLVPCQATHKGLPYSDILPANADNCAPISNIRNRAANQG